MCTINITAYTKKVRNLIEGTSYIHTTIYAYVYKHTDTKNILSRKNKDINVNYIISKYKGQIFLIKLEE